MKYENVINRMNDPEITKGHTMRCKHVAVILKNGIPVSEYKFNYESCDTFNKFSVHAEINVIYNILKIYKYPINNKDLSVCLKKNMSKNLSKILKKISSFDILVIRISKDGILLNSKPCSNCQCAIRSLRFRNVIYTSGNIDDPLIIQRNKEQII